MGNRIHAATFKKHNGNVENGQETLNKESDWTTFTQNWPCELMAVRGGETIRGRQVAEHTTHVLFGEYYGAVGITPEMKCVIAGKTRNIVSVMDMDGDSREMRIELKEEGADGS